MNACPLVSIIVPVFKTEQYLKKCVESILGQTYQNIEVILINDGSPDGCGMLCDEYAKRDGRVHVIHKQNGGQASARNLGLQNMNGAYVAFVDSDDYIEPDMIAYLYELIRQYDGDISMCAFHKFTSSSDVLPVFEEKIETYQNQEAMKLLIEDTVVGSHPCNKIFAASLWKDVFFPEGRVYEDLAIMPEVFHRAKKLVVSNQMKYHYLTNPNSTSYTQNKRWAYSLFLALVDRHAFCSEKYPDLAHMTEVRAVGMGIGMYISMCRFRKSADIAAWKKRIRCYIREHRAQLRSREISAGRRLVGRLILLCPVIVDLVYSGYYQLRGMNSNE